MPGIFEDHLFVRNNITTSHLNDHFVLCIFLCVQRAGTAMWVSLKIKI